jgi:hypothetical protein
LDFVEKATEQYLLSLGIGEVRHCPLGKGTFPDFSVNGRIGVECTRLVHLVEKNGVEYNLDELQPRIVQSLENSLNFLKFNRLEDSYFVCLNYKIDIDIRQAQRQLKTYLSDLSCASGIVNHRQVITEGLQVEILRASSRYEAPFVLGAVSCRDNAAWVLEQLAKQTKAAVLRKSKKLEASKNRFAEWWLAVSGILAVGLSETYAEFVEAELRDSQLWDKVLLIDPHQPHKSRAISINDR